MQTLNATGRLGLVLHPRRDPTPVVEKLTSWARSHGKQVIVDARDAARLSDDVEPVSETQLVNTALHESVTNEGVMGHEMLGFLARVGREADQSAGPVGEGTAEVVAECKPAPVGGVLGYDRLDASGSSFMK
jgi:hypothetical protein